MLCCRKGKESLWLWPKVGKGRRRGETGWGLSSEWASSPCGRSLFTSFIHLKRIDRVPTACQALFWILGDMGETPLRDLLSWREHGGEAP